MASASPTPPAAALQPMVAAFIQAHPGFNSAIRNSTSGPLALLDDDPSFYRCIADIPTYALGVLALYLYSIDRLYHRGLQGAAKGLFSAGRATAILARMQRAGLIVPKDAFRIGRQRRYAPAPAMLRAFRASYRIEVHSLALMDSRLDGLVQTYDDDPAVFDTVVAFLAKSHMQAPTLDQDLVDPLGGVGRRSMGLFTAYALAEAAFIAGHPRAQGEVRTSISRLANRLGVSRTHTRRILKMLQDAGLVVVGDQPGRITLTPAFADAYELYFFGMFSALLAAVQDQVRP